MSQFLTGLNLLNPGVKKYDGGGTSFTMDDNGTTNGTLLWVDGVAQIPGTDYNISGTTITTTSSTPSGTNNVVSLQLFSTGIIGSTGDNTVTTAKIVDDAVTAVKIHVKVAVTESGHAYYLDYFKVVIKNLKEVFIWD